MISVVNSKPTFIDPKSMPKDHKVDKKEEVKDTQGDSKVEAIKKQISEGKYEINLRNLANKVADSLM